MKSDEEFDLMFDRAIAEASGKHEFVPDPEISWMKVKKQLGRRAKRRSRMKVLPYIAASFLVGAVLLGGPVKSQAFPFFHAVKSIQDDVVKLIFGSGGDNAVEPKTAPPPEHSGPEGSVDESGGTTEQQSFHSLADAKAHADMELPAMNYVPDGYELKEAIILSSKKGKSDSATITYSSSEGKIFTVTVRNVRAGELVTTGGGLDGIREIKIGGSNAYLFHSEKDGISSLEYMKSNLFILIYGVLSPEDITSIAEQAY
ncbi:MULTISPECIES: DUF4367 domain-containing protein [unclassified Paenibacillus]|uniref:DUF4367 domain-containing protein n=1 Tax=unclassified Paenibacillus TaxID=185978 RepID=UPI0009548D97|nr:MULTISPECIES: DUF4367 domain-containing protein [unclassified Paenibacillus]ASS68304.2 DUF4367 domain-containing protein [Paenibacillus sp. RUD330]SIR28304.1 protein of unknown function [Paenibacillus sp. RU4X]SIR40647.1 protein of unknown function [Paenibacillus sp. RU4T]